MPEVSSSRLGSPSWTQAVADQIRPLCQESYALRSSVVWVNGGVHDDGRLVMIYRQSPGTPLLGLAWDISDQPASYGLADGSSADPAVLAPLIFFNDIDDPSEPGTDVPGAALAARWNPDGLPIAWHIGAPKA
jgi:hypothetical protein